MPKFDIATNSGLDAAYVYREALRALLMRKTAKERHMFLEERGWVLLSRTVSPHAQPHDRKVEKIWKTTERGVKDGYLTTLCQTRAIGLQLWWNMQDAGVMVNSSGRLVLLSC